MLPGSFPSGEHRDTSPSTLSHPRTKRKNTVLSIDTQADVDDEDEGRFTGGPIIDSPNDDEHPQSGSPVPGARERTTTSRKHRPRVRHNSLICHTESLKFVASDRNAKSTEQVPHKNPAVHGLVSPTNLQTMTRRWCANGMNKSILSSSLSVVFVLNHEHCS